MTAESFEYGDLAELVSAGWTLTDTMAGVGSASMSTTRFTDGARSLRIDIDGTTASSQNFYYERTFADLTPNTAYTVSVSCWENEERRGTVGIACGLQVVGGTSEYVTQNGTVSFWQRFHASGLADGSGNLTVRVGFYHSLVGGVYDREAYFDAMTIISANQWADIMLNAGILSVDGTRVGYSAGGLAFDVDKTVQSLEVEGRVTPMVGMDRVIAVKARFHGNMITANEQVRALIEPGATITTDSPDTLYTPLAGRTFFGAGDYLTDVRLTWPRIGGGFLQVRFPKAICLKWGLTGKDKSEVMIPIDIEARAATSLTILPYTVALIN